MAILHRNPMPLNGALFVTNPRRRSARRNRISHRPTVGMRNPLRMRRNSLVLRRNVEEDLFGDQDMPNTGSINTGKTTKTQSKTEKGRKAKVAKKKTLKQRLDDAPKYVQEYIAKNKKGRLSHKQFDDLEQKAKAARKRKKPASSGSKKRKKESLTSLRERAKALGVVGYSDAKRAKLQRMIREPEKYQSRKGGGKRKKSEWDKVKMALSGSGLKMAEVKKLYKDVKDGKKSLADLRKLKTAIRSYSKSQFKVGRTRRQHAIYGKAAKGKSPAIKSMMAMDEYKVLFNPFKKVNVRKNPVLGINLLAGPLSLIQKAQDSFSRLPYVGVLAPAVTPMALGGGAFAIHLVAEPVVNKGLQGLADMDVPLISPAVASFKEHAFDKAPYTTTGLTACLALIAGSMIPKKKPLFDIKAASIVGGTLAGVGVVMDLMTKPVADAAVEVVTSSLEEDLAGMHMNGAHMGAIEMGGAHQMGAIHMNGAHRMGAIEMGAVEMGAVEMGAAHLGYSDASVADAYDCNCIMHPEEVAAAKAGMQAWMHKFGQSPKSLRSTQSLKSRHAGRHGHRFGWCIKMIGFENFQKIASLPPKKRAIVLSQLKQQAIASVPTLVAAQQQDYSSIESASIPLSGTFNGAHGAEGLGYGAMMFAGQGY